MKGMRKFKKFAENCHGKSIIDLIEALFLVEQNECLSVFGCVVEYDENKKRICPILSTHQCSMGYPATIDGAIDFLMKRDMENKYCVHSVYIRKDRVINGPNETNIIYHLISSNDV